MVRIARLARPTGPGAPCYRFGSNEDGHEREYFPAYLSLLASAKSLAAVTVSPPPYQDAYHLLNFSIECFMKYIYCVVREELWVIQTPDAFAPTIPFLYRRAFAKKHDKLSAGSFGHDIVLLMDELIASTDLTKNDFVELKRDLGLDRNSWVSDRYKTRQHSLYKLKFERRLRKFEAVLTGTLQGFA